VSIYTNMTETAAAPRFSYGFLRIACVTLGITAGSKARPGLASASGTCGNRHGLRRKAEPNLLHPVSEPSDRKRWSITRIEGAIPLRAANIGVSRLSGSWRKRESPASPPDVSPVAAIAVAPA